MTTTEDIQLIFRGKGMWYGRMLTYSKSFYRKMHPDHTVIFNAEIHTMSNGKVWYGDLDITDDTGVLETIAKILGEKLYVLQESTYLFGDKIKSAEDLIKNAVMTIG